MMNLSMANENEELKVIQIEDGNNSKKDLLALGICRNALIKVIKNDISSPMILNVRGIRVVLGREHAKMIIVKEENP
jgi:ferrous iron transport protein A